MVEGTTMVATVVVALPVAWDNVLVGCRKQEYWYVLVQNDVVCILVHIAYSLFS